MPFTDGRQRHDDGTYTFSYTDKNLSPLPSMSIRFRPATTTRLSSNDSIYSRPLTCRTKDHDYPDISVTIDGKEKQTVLPICIRILWQPQR